MVEMFASRTPMVRCVGAAAAVLAVAGLAGCGSAKVSSSAATTSMPVVTQGASTGSDGGSGDATTTGTASTASAPTTGTATTGTSTTGTSTRQTSTTGGSTTGSPASSHASQPVTSRTATPPASTRGTSADTHECRAGQLRADAYPLTQTSTHEQMALTFTNTSSAACTMRGYPGADLMDMQRTVAHARRVQNAPITTVVLRPGATARAILDSVKGEIASGFLVVTPPNQQQSMPVQLVMPAKGFSVGPVMLDPTAH